MAKATKRAPADYVVGRGKPPAHSRFRPGQSGNPGGRKKGSRNLKSVLEEVMREEIELTENGKKRSVSLLEALIKRAVRYERHVGVEPEFEEELPDDDKAILQRMLALRAASRPADRSQSRPGQDDEGGTLSEDDDE